MGEMPKPLPRRRRPSKACRSKAKAALQSGVHHDVLVARPNIPHHNNFSPLSGSDEERPQKIYARRARNMQKPLQTTHFSNGSGRPKSNNPTKIIRRVYQAVNTRPQWRPKRQRMPAPETMPRGAQLDESYPPRIPVANRLTFPEARVTGKTILQAPPRKSVFERLGSKARTSGKSLVITAPVPSQKKRRKVTQVEIHSVYTIGTEDAPESPVEHHAVHVVSPIEGIEEPVGTRTRQQRAKSAVTSHRQQLGPSTSGAQQAGPQDEQNPDEPIDLREEEGSTGLGKEPPSTLEAQVAWLTQQLKDQQQKFMQYRLQSELEKIELLRQFQEIGVRENPEKGKGESVVNPLIVEEPHPNSSTNRDIGEEKLAFTRKELQEMINQQLQAAGVAPTIPISKRSGRPYPAFYDTVPYPKGYIVPRFKTFFGESLKGTNPDEHLAHFQASCGNTANNDALLLRQFPQSLSGPAFTWYYSLENGSIQCWDDLVDAFRAKFAVIVERVTMADLVNTKPKKDEKLLEYVNRWRNLSIKCERPITEGEAVEFIMRNIDNWMTPFLGVANIRTYHDLNQCIHRLETNPPSGWSDTIFQRTQKNWKPEPKGTSNPKSFGTRAETQSVGTSKDENKSTFGENNLSGKTLKELKSQPYSFRKDRVSKLFDDALRRGYLSLPESKRPTDIERSADLNYCKYHRMIGHPIEDCFVFKNWLERKYKNGDIDISKKHLLDTPASHEQVNQVSHTIKETNQ